MTLREIQEAIISTAENYLGVREEGANSGYLVEKFQKATDGKAEKEPWCMCFVQYVSLEVCDLYGIKPVLYPSEHVQTVYVKTPAKYRSNKPGPGKIMIMRKRTVQWQGHTGIELDEGCMSFGTIEGNTNSAGGREGDGVYKKKRFTKGNAIFEMRGHIDFPQMVYDRINGNF